MIFSIFNFLDIFFISCIIIFSKFDFARDNKDRNALNLKMHGIVKSSNSRLGGFIILIFILFSYIFYYEGDYFLLNNNIFLASVLFVGLLGFADDAYSGIHYYLKLFFLIFVNIILFISFNQFLFFKTGLEFFNILLSNNIFAFFVSILIITGFTNAFNMADGANGIASGIASAIFLLFYFETNEIFFLLIFKIIIIFFINNIIFGKMFLGDSGSYFLGFTISVVSIYLYNQNQISAGILATFLSYPSLEILFTIIRRLFINTNPLRPDNGHLHNLIYKRIENKNYLFFSQNTYTGFVILSLFLLPGLILYFLIGEVFHFYFWILFVLQVICYLFIYIKLQSKI